MTGAEGQSGRQPHLAHQAHLGWLLHGSLHLHGQPHCIGYAHCYHHHPITICIIHAQLLAHMITPDQPSGPESQVLPFGSNKDAASSRFTSAVGSIFKPAVGSMFSPAGCRMFKPAVGSMFKSAWAWLTTPNSRGRSQQMCPGLVKTQTREYYAGTVVEKKRPPVHLIMYASSSQHMLCSV